MKAEDILNIVIEVTGVSIVEILNCDARVDDEKKTHAKYLAVSLLVEQGTWSYESISKIFVQHRTWAYKTMKTIDNLLFDNAEFKRLHREANTKLVELEEREAV